MCIQHCSVYQKNGNCNMKQNIIFLLIDTKYLVFARHYVILLCCLWWKFKKKNMYVLAFYMTKYDWLDFSGQNQRSFKNLSSLRTRGHHIGYWHDILFYNGGTFWSKFTAFRLYDVICTLYTKPRIYETG